MVSKVLEQSRRAFAVSMFAAVLATLTAPVPASAAKDPCERTMLWTSVWTEDTWKLTRCGNTMDVVRWGGELGACTVSYPVGSRYESPEDDCAYRVNGGPI